MSLLAVVVSAAISIPTGSPYTQRFDGIGATATASLPADFKLDRPSAVRTLGTFATAVSATTHAGGTNLSTSASNGAYNFGATANAHDRAIGFLSSSGGTQSGNLYAQLANNAGTPLTVRRQPTARRWPSTTSTSRVFPPRRRQPTQRRP